MVPVMRKPLSLLALILPLVAFFPAVDLLAEEEALDIKAVFRELRDLGLPSVKDTSEVWLSARDQDEGAEYLWLERLAWLSNHPANGKRVVYWQVLDAPWTEPDRSATEADKPTRIEIDPFGESLGFPNFFSVLAVPGLRVTPNPRPSVEAIALRQIERLRKGGEYDSEQRWQEVGHSERTMSLFLATHLDERGAEEIARDLAKAALESSATPDEAVLHAHSKLAEARYAAALLRFSESRDLVQWSREVEELADKFEKITGYGPVLRRIAGDAAAALGPPPDLPAEALALYRHWISGAGYEMPGSRHPWTSQMYLHWMFEENLASREDPLSRLLGKGPGALPLLLALAETRATVPGAAFPNRGSIFFGRTLPKEEESERLYQYEFSRPRTTGELAREIIVGALPEMLLIGDHGQLREKVENFLAKFPHDDRAALARIYLTTGNSNLRRSAWYYLLESANPRIRAEAEAHLLDRHPRRETADLLVEFASANPKRVVPLMKEFLTRVYRELEETDPDYFRREWDIQGGLEEFKLRELHELLAPLEAWTSNLSMETMIQKVVLGENTLTAMAIRNQLFRNWNPSEYNLMILQATAEAERAEDRLRIFAYLKDDLLPAPPLSGENALWRVLLSDERPSEYRDRSFTIRDTVARFSVETFLRLREPDIFRDTKRLGMCRLIAGNAEIGEAMLKRARSILAGDAPGPWIDQIPVVDPRTQELVKELRHLDPASLHARLRALSVEEKFSIYRHPQFAEIRGRAKSIVYDVELPEGDEACFASAKRWVGKKFSREMLSEMTALMSREDAGDVQMEMGNTNIFPPGISIQIGKGNRNYRWNSVALDKPALTYRLSLIEEDGWRRKGTAVVVALDEADKAKFSPEQLESRVPGENKFVEICNRIMAPDVPPGLGFYLSISRIRPGSPPEEGFLPDRFPNLPVHGKN